MSNDNPRSRWNRARFRRRVFLAVGIAAIVAFALLVFIAITGG